MYANHVVLFRKLRTLGQWDAHTPYSFQDLPRNYFTFALDILSHFAINIPLAMLTYRFVETPFNILGNKLAMKIPKGYTIKKSRAALFGMIYLLIAVTFVWFYQASLH